MNANQIYRFQFVGDEYQMVSRSNGEVLQSSPDVDMYKLIYNHYNVNLDFPANVARAQAANAYEQINTGV